MGEDIKMLKEDLPAEINIPIVMSVLAVTYIVVIYLLFIILTK